MIVLEPFDLRTSTEDLRALASGLCGIGLEAPHHAVRAWVARDDGSVLVISSYSDYVAPLFEVATLAVSTLDEFRRVEAAFRAAEPTPELLAMGFAASAQRPKAKMPDPLRAWPYQQWNTQVVLRQECAVTLAEQEVQTLGFGPKAVFSAPMGEAPCEAEICIAAIGLLFTGAVGGRLLLASGLSQVWALELIDDDDQISAIVDGVRLVDIDQYLAERNGSSAG